MLRALESFDHALFHWINQVLANSLFDAFFPFLTNLNKTPWFTSIVLPIILLLWFIKGRKKALKVFVLMIVAAGLSDTISYRVLKSYFNRPRPNHLASVTSTLRVPYGPKSASMPSNHAFTSATVAAVISSFYPVAAVYVWTIAGLNAYSRVYVGVHFPFDVLVGLLLGLLVGRLVSIIGRRWIK
ncbi:MAG: phosphatase PAP2 family protein [Bdellovibrionaceae bacterium]|nr:phosphatase PAP2 family protein [Pseudobdellovibrionaceae bacterium]